MIHIHFLVARFQIIILFIVQYKDSHLVLKIRYYKILFSAQDYAVVVLLLNMVESFIFDGGMTKMIRRT